MDNFQVIDEEELKGNARTIYVWDPAKQVVVADVAELNADGTGRALLTGQDFTWEMNADGGPEEVGKIVHLESSGWTAEYLSFLDIDALASDIFWEVRVGNDGSDGVFMGAGASVFADPEYAVEFTAEDVVGRFYQFGKGDETLNDSRLDGFRLRFDEDFTGSEESDYRDPATGLVALDSETNKPYFGFVWSIEDGPVGVEVVVSKTFNTSTQQYSCAVGSANCIVWDERRIIPIVADDEHAQGLRVYWMEVRRSAGEGVVGPDTPETKLVRFYDYAPFAAAPVGVSAKIKGGEKVTKQHELLRGAKQR
jgi:hypothetical protein